eukprot:3363194-Rhodomonas_salina.1
MSGMMERGGRGVQDRGSRWGGGGQGRQGWELRKHLTTLVPSSQPKGVSDLASEPQARPRMIQKHQLPRPKSAERCSGGCCSKDSLHGPRSHAQHAPPALEGSRLITCGVYARRG